jgi:enoyl-CoA hydratase/carnithine racemase
MHQSPLLLRTIQKVVIAMVNGPAVGGRVGARDGLDFRIAGRFAGVGYSGDSWTLTRLVDTAKARELYFLGRINSNRDRSEQVALRRLGTVGIAPRSSNFLPQTSRTI